MMASCRKIDFSSKSKNIILIATLLLSLDVFLLSFFSSWYAKTHGGIRKFHLAGVIVTSCFVSAFLYCLGVGYRMKVKEDVKSAIDSKDSEVDAEFLATLSDLPKRFSFQDIASATSDFSHKLGFGGFGSVYAGSFPDGSDFAVKRLEKGSLGQKEFCSEVAIISRVRHLNLICMKGFCVEGTERLLIYEYMPRGSLDRWIFNDNSRASSESSQTFVLNWDIRHRIAVETARGLAYLHDDCEEAILHLDVKPQNVLLDENFRAKVSDFGLSRSLDRAESRVVTTIRGTPGYLAPEWFSGLGIGVKTDVYGYGMLILELVSGRRAVDQSQNDIEDWFLPAMAFRKLKEGKALEVIDPFLHEKMDKPSHQTQALTIIKVALWCIQEEASERPSMSDIVQMLEGKVQVTDPPLSRNFIAANGSRDDSLTSITIIDDQSLVLPR